MVFESGRVDEADLAGLIANADAIVYPSFYEGFGLPVVQSLSYGRTVIVRGSDLWSEIGSRAALPGSIVEFTSDGDLIEAVGRAVHGLAPKARVGEDASAGGKPPPNWADCADRILVLLDQLLFDADGRRWLERELVLGLWRR